jgi:hypothetical protein
MNERVRDYFGAMGEEIRVVKQKKVDSFDASTEGEQHAFTSLRRNKTNTHFPLRIQSGSIRGIQARSRLL